MTRDVGDASEELQRLLRRIEEIEEPQQRRALPEAPKPGSKQTELGRLARRVAVIIVVAAGAAAIVGLEWPAISILVVRDGTGDTKSTTVPSASRAPNTTNSEVAVPPHPVLIGALQQTSLRPDQAWPLGLHTNPEAAAGTLVVKGLAAGAKLSVGRPLDANGWELKTDELKGAVIIPPPGFSGSMELSLELQLAEGRVADRRSVLLEWARSPEQPKPAVAQTGGMDARGLAVRKLNPNEIVLLRKGGEELLARRDIAAARLMLVRAAEAADAGAALALAKTYDPMALGDVGLRGAFADPAMARTWYEKAREFGSTEAERRLHMLASQGE